ncbi:ABC transporter ATP-binding protein [Spirochaetia bacterium]|nr:ABC transporter ATP-binding protein [Spirochaetia bacterium]
MNLKLIPTLLTAAEKRRLVLVLILLLVMGFIELVGIGSLGPFISVVSNPQMIHTNTYLSSVYTYFNFTSDSRFIVVFGIAVVIVLALSNFCLAAINYIILRYSNNRRHSIAMRLLEKYLRQPYIFYLNAKTSELSRNILNDVGNFVSNVLLALLQLISGSIVSLSIFILLIIINPLLALIVSAVLGLSYVIIFSVVRKFLARKGAERTVQNALKYKYVNEIFGGIKDIKILGKEHVFLNFFSGPSQKSARSDAASEVINDLPKYLIETIAIGGIIGVIVILIHSGATIESFLPVLTVYAFGAYRLLPLLQRMFQAFARIKYNFSIVENLYRDFKTLPEGAALSSENTPRMDFHRTIKLENIVFAYPNTEKNIIKNQSLCIASNTSVALVGATGCGKTTMVDIILGLLEAQGGKLFIDNTEINDTNRKNWQKNLGYVPQSIYLTDDTIRNNIAFGIDPAKIDDGAVMNAAKLANIHDFVVTELKEGYNTIIGERGIRLSGGQRQRVGIARAIYHDPSVLILDEATSALDSLTENAIMDAIKNLGHKKTILMIAHRITTVKNCDVIYMMDRGIIIDSGSYEELYNKNESFRKMADGA